MGPISFVPILARVPFRPVAREAEQLPRQCCQTFSSHACEVFVVAVRNSNHADRRNRDLDLQKTTSIPKGSPSLYSCRGTYEPSNGTGTGEQVRRAQCWQSGVGSIYGRLTARIVTEQKFAVRPAAFLNRAYFAGSDPRTARLESPEGSPQLGGRSVGRHVRTLSPQWCPPPVLARIESIVTDRHRPMFRRQHTVGSIQQRWVWVRPWRSNRDPEEMLPLVNAMSRWNWFHS